MQSMSRLRRQKQGHRQILQRVRSPHGDLHWRPATRSRAAT